MATSVLEAVESSTQFVRSAIILKGDENRPTRLFAHSRKDAELESFRKDMANVDLLLSSGISAGVVKRTLATGDVQVIGNVEEEDCYVAADENVRSELCMPLIERGRVFGALNIESPHKHAFGRADVTFVSTISTQIGLALRTTLAMVELSSQNSILDFLDNNASGV